MKKTILITGASRGLGHSLAELLERQEDYSIYAGVRNLQTCLPLSNSNFIHLDLNDQNSMTQAVDSIIQNEGKIDCLVHNAGIVIAGPIEGMTQEEIRQLFEVNFFGVVFLTNL